MAELALDEDELDEDKNKKAKAVLTRVQELARTINPGTRQIWSLLTAYANADDAELLLTFLDLITACMARIGGDTDDLGLCQDVNPAGTDPDLDIGNKISVLGPLAKKYQPDLYRALVWLSDPRAHREGAGQAAKRLAIGAGIQMEVTGNTSFKDDEPVLYQWPSSCQSVMSPVYKFLLDQIARRDDNGESLQDVIPLGVCWEGCRRVFVYIRKGRKEFCNNTCRQDHWNHLHPGARKETMKENRKTEKRRAAIQMHGRKPFRHRVKPF